MSTFSGLHDPSGTFAQPNSPFSFSVFNPTAFTSAGASRSQRAIDGDEKKSRSAVSEEVQFPEAEFGGFRPLREKRLERRLDELEEEEEEDLLVDDEFDAQPSVKNYQSLSFGTRRRQQA